MNPDQIGELLRQSDGFFCARWGRPIAPVVFGLHDDLLPVMKGAIQTLALLCSHDIVDTDPEFGSNLFMFFFEDWEELADVPNLAAMIPELSGMIDRAKSSGASQARIFRYDETGAIKTLFSMMRLSDQRTNAPADIIALDQAVRAFTVWAPQAFTNQAPLVQAPGRAAMIRPEIAALLRAIYDPVLPGYTRDSSHALRLAARMENP